VIVNAYATHREPPPLEFAHQLRARRDRDDPELGPHLQGFAGFVMANGEREMTALRYGVLHHLERVHHHLAFETEDSQGLQRWARDANALLFLDDGTVRAPDGKVLVDPETGEPEPGAALPYPADATARKTATDLALAERGITIPPSLPPTISAIEVELREPREVAARVLSLFICAVRAEGLGEGNPLEVEVIRERVPRGFDALTPIEAAFMAEASPNEQAVMTHVWRYEAIVPLAWALGLVDQLAFPTAICDVPGLAKTLLNLDADTLLATATLRPVAEILDALDQTFRLHWAVVDAQVREADPPAELEGGVITERHHALNWLTRFGDADWDEVETPT